MLHAKNLTILTLLVSLTLFTVACGEAETENQATNQNTDNQNTTNQNTDNQNTDNAAFALEVDTASSTLSAVAGESIVIGFIVENNGAAESTATVALVIGDHTDSMDIPVAAGADAAGSFTWETTDIAPGNYTAELSIGDVTATADITLNGVDVDDNQNAGGAFFEVTIDADSSTLEVTLGEPLIIMIIGANTGDEAGIIDLSGQVALEGGAIAQLQLEQQGEGANTPIEPGQGIQIQAQLPTGGQNGAPVGTHTITVSSGDTEASTQLVVNPAE